MLKKYSTLSSNSKIQKVQQTPTNFTSKLKKKEGIINIRSDISSKATTSASLSTSKHRLPQATAIKLSFVSYRMEKAVVKGKSKMERSRQVLQDEMKEEERNKTE